MDTNLIVSSIEVKSCGVHVDDVSADCSQEVSVVRDYKNGRRPCLGGQTETEAEN